MEVSAFDSLIPYPDSAVGYHLALSQNPVACDASGIPKDTSFTVTVYRKSGTNSMEVAKGVYTSVRVGFSGYSSTYKSKSGKATVPLVENSSSILRYAESLQICVGESSYDIADIANISVAFTYDGKKGDTGINRIPVPYGEYSSEVTYTATDLIAPYVLLAGKYYVMNKTTSVKGLNPQTDYAANGTKATWIYLEHFKAAFFEIFMANLGLIGKAVFYNEYMFSQQGIDASGNATSDYGKFGTGDFTPNLLLNFLSGEIRTNSGIFKGSVATPFGAGVVSATDRILDFSTGFNFQFEGGGDVILPHDEKYDGIECSLFSRFPQTAFTVRIEQNDMFIDKDHTIRGGGYTAINVSGKMLRLKAVKHMQKVYWYILNIFDFTQEELLHTIK